MDSSFTRDDILKSLEMLADWLKVKHPGSTYDLVIVGGAALALSGYKDQTNDVDVFRPRPLPGPLLEGIRAVARTRRLSSEWLNDHVADILAGQKLTGKSGLPAYFEAVSERIVIADNLGLSIIGRQALISLKLYAASPSFRKHTDDLRALNPSSDEIREAVRFSLDLDRSSSRVDDLRVVIQELEFDPDEILQVDEE